MCHRSLLGGSLHLGTLIVAPKSVPRWPLHLPLAIDGCFGVRMGSRRCSPDPLPQPRRSTKALLREPAGDLAEAFPRTM